MGNSFLEMTDTEISNNVNAGIYMHYSDVECYGSPAGRYGSWGNSTYGIYSYVPSNTYQNYILSSDCDFGVGADDNSNYDVVLNVNNNNSYYNYGDDANFVCQTVTGLCQ